MTQPAYIKEIKKEIEWVERIIGFRKNNSTDDPRLEEGLQPPVLDPTHSIYSEFVTTNVESFEERLLLVLSILPHVDPAFLTVQLDRNVFYQRNFQKMESADVIIGKISGEMFKGLLPTGLLYLYLMAGNNMSIRLELIGKIFSNSFYLIHQDIIRPLPVSEAEPILSNVIVMDKGYLLKFITNINIVPNENERKSLHI